MHNLTGRHRPRRGGPPSRRAGFTLLELMIALMMLGVGVLGVAQVFAVANRHTAHAREETAAVCLAEEIREKIMSESFEDIYSIFNGVDTNDAGSIPLPAHDWATHVEDGLGIYGRGQIEVRRPEDDPGLSPGMVGVTVTMTWREGSRVVTLPLYFSVAKTTP